MEIANHQLSSFAFTLLGKKQSLKCILHQVHFLQFPAENWFFKTVVPDENTHCYVMMPSPGNQWMACRHKSLEMGLAA